ncbi:MAG: hypothetical protein IKQ49_07265 [Eubacterium sp.]|nr:hypothetical protein [Eubacterium sp.]
MQRDFHYYATYCAAFLAGYSHAESEAIAYSAALVDFCSATFLTELNGPGEAATTQLQLEMMEMPTDRYGRQEITRIWAAFHFLPYDLHAEVKGGRKYRDKYRMICNTNSDLLVETVQLAKDASPEAAGIAMHVLADTWAHRYFAGTPSLVINNTNYHFYEEIPGKGSRPVIFRHNPSRPDDPEHGIYTNTIYQMSENSIMNLGHGRAGHLPDFSFIKYRYLPAWAQYEEYVKDNPKEFYTAFCQMVYALKYLRGVHPTFEKEVYDTEAVEPYREEIDQFLRVRRVDSDLGWKVLGERLSGNPITDFMMDRYKAEYRSAKEKDDTVLGRFFTAAIKQKQLVSLRIAESGNHIVTLRKIKHQEEKKQKKEGKAV